MKLQPVGLPLSSMAFVSHPCGRPTLPSRNLHSGGGATDWRHLPDPHDLRAVFPDDPISRPCSFRSRVASLGVVQRYPSVVSRRGVHSRRPSTGEPASSHLRDESATSRPRSALVVSHHFDGFLLHAMALRPFRASTSTVPTSRTFSARFRPWGSPRFGGPGFRLALASPPDPVAHVPVMRSCPSKPSLRPQLRRPDQPVRRHHLSTAGMRHHPRRSPGWSSRSGCSPHSLPSRRPSPHRA